MIVFLLAFVPNLAVTFASPGGVRGPGLVWILLVALLSGGVGFVVSGAVLRPLSRLESEVGEGSFSDPHADDPSEILALRGAFSGLLHKLSTEQGRRNAFLATLVHDLKTPLIATGHLTQALTTLPLPEAERREVGAQIQAETGRLLALVQQMADAHRFEREDVKLQLADVNLRSLLDDVARRFMPRAEELGLSLQVQGHGHALADAGALERAVANLTENALRYAENRITLLVTPQGITVANDGPALNTPLDELAQPFNAQPATIAGQQYTAGTAGLGLFIVRRIAEAHGGRLEYARQPLAPLPEHPAAVQPDTSTAAPPSLGDLPSTLFHIHLPEVTT